MVVRLTGALLLLLVACESRVAREALPPASADEEDDVYRAVGDRPQSPPVARYEIVRPPYLQLGNAPLAPYSGSENDQVELIWHSRAVAAGRDDRFEVRLRRVGGQDYRSIDVGPGEPMGLGFDNRHTHRAVLLGLSYGADYEYELRHLLGEKILASHSGTFRTRLAPGDDTPFSFVAYGDSLHYRPGELDPDPLRERFQPFVTVQESINRQSVAFALLLGDNAYFSGTHAEYEGRFDPRVNPAAVRWNGSKIDYPTAGNHDIRTQWGQPMRDNYSVPIPIENENAPASGPVGEYPEHHYSFDYGLGHFVTFDSNSRNVAPQHGVIARLDRQLDWVVKDLARSTATWKIVFCHHHLEGTDHFEECSKDYYYRQLVNRLRAAGVDLLLVGHTHEFLWSYPLRSVTEAGEVDFDRDRDQEYAKGSGIIQLVSGVGGGSLRPSRRDFDELATIASGYSASDSKSDRTGFDPAARSRFGYARIDVSRGRLVVGYVDAATDSVIDGFQIVAPREE